MARQTIPIVRLRIPHHFAMRIVTAHATDAAIDSIEAFAFLETIRLELHIDLSGHTALHHVRETAMTLSAESGNVLRFHAAQLLWHEVRLAPRDRLCVQTRRRLAMLTLNARSKSIELDTAAQHGPSRMAVETRPRLNVGDRTAHRFDNIPAGGISDRP
jgi:hypothetical protein